MCVSVCVCVCVCTCMFVCTCMYDDTDREGVGNQTRQVQLKLALTRARQEQ